ncbi:CopG family ribbon-helix-helix protein [Methylobacterium brachiatum]|jgi:predicted transcriptional regulator|uniref:CopG family transcriptional regulator n=1 Tax=Methylobacterium brachiatum TaxID=269660 RepID=A0ABV1R3M0_9HYPH
MPASTTMTIQVSPEIKSTLERIAIDTRRSISFLAAEAVSACVERELQSLDGIKRALADARLGHVVPHDDAMAEIHAVIDAAEAARDADM